MAVDVAELRQTIVQGALNVVQLATPMLIDSLTGFVWDWQSGGDRDEFPAHVALNGGFGADEGAFGGFHPGDHHGCRCRLVDVRETAKVVSISGGSTSAVAKVDFADDFASQPLSVSVSLGGVTVTAAGSIDAGDWQALVQQVEQRWPEVCQRVVDAGALSG